MPQSENDISQTESSAFSAFGYRPYRFFFMGALLSLIGRQMLVVAVGWDIYDKTSSPMALAYIGLVEVVPVILLTLLAGHVADSFSRKGIIMLSQLGVTLAMVGLAIVSSLHMPLYLIYVMLFVFGVAKSFSSPANAAILSQIVPAEEITNAVTWNSVTFQTASILGPLLAGALIAFQHGASGAYLVSGICAFLFFLLMLGVKTTPVPQNKRGITLASLAGGLKFVWSTKVILSAITLDLFAVLLGGAATLLPVFARDILHVGPLGLGVLQAAPSVGAVIMALTLARKPITRRAGPALLWCVAGFGIATIIFGISQNVGLSFLMLFLLGALDNVSVVVRAALVQLRTPPELLGRVSAINFVFIGTSNELGGFESGLVAHFFGPVLSVISGGLGTILVVILTALMWPEIRKLDQIHPAS